MTLADTVKSLRDALGAEQGEKVSLERAAGGMGLSTQTLWRIESGNQPKPSLTTMEKIADYYGVPVFDLIALRGSDSLTGAA